MDYAEPDLVKLSESDIHLDEPWQDIRQLDVYDTHGEQIGSVEDLYVDRHARDPRFLDVSAGGFLGIGKKHFLIPVDLDGLLVPPKPNRLKRVPLTARSASLSYSIAQDVLQCCTSTD